MNTNMQTLAIIKALAIYNTKGVIAAINLLKQSGMTLNEALDVLAVYDDAADTVRQMGNPGKLSK